MEEEPTLAQKQEFARVSLRNYAVISLTSMASLALYVVYESMVQAAVSLVIIGVVSVYLLKDRETLIMIPLENKTVLVTGCDTGCGRALAVRLASMGVTVFAGCQNSGGEGAITLRNLKNPKLRVVQLDVTNDQEVQDVAALVRTSTQDKGLWGVVHAAGIVRIGDIELTTMAQYERLANVNQLGLVRVTKAFLPLVRRYKGRVVNIVGNGKFISCCNNSAYMMTLRASDAFTDRLRTEMDKFDVTVVTIESCHYEKVTAGSDIERLRSDFLETWGGLSEELRSSYVEQDTFNQLKHLETHTSNVQRDYELNKLTNVIVESLFVASPKERYLMDGFFLKYGRFS